MNPDSPWYKFSRDSIGSLHRRHGNGETILKSDLIPILESDQASLDDPIMRDYLLRSLRGELKPPRGRTPYSPERELRVCAAAELLPVVTAEVREERRRKGVAAGRTLVEPCVEAANRLGDQLHLSNGRSLLNEISAWKRKHIKRKARAQAA